MEQIASNLTIENRRNNFINRKMIFNVLGLLLCIEAGNVSDLRRSITLP